MKTAPSPNSTSRRRAFASGESAIFVAILSTDFLSFSQAPNTPEPTVVTCDEPPSIGAIGSVESPSWNVTSSIGKPMASAAIIDITV